MRHPPKFSKKFWRSGKTQNKEGNTAFRHFFASSVIPSDGGETGCCAVDGPFSQTETTEITIKYLAIYAEKSF